MKQKRIDPGSIRLRGHQLRGTGRVTETHRFPMKSCSLFTNEHGDNGGMRRKILYGKCRIKKNFLSETFLQSYRMEGEITVVVTNSWFASLASGRPAIEHCRRTDAFLSPSRTVRVTDSSILGAFSCEASSGTWILPKVCVQAGS